MSSTEVQHPGLAREARFNRSPPNAAAHNRAPERLADLGQLAAGVAHDITNVLTVIKLYADLLVDHPGLDATAQAHLRTIRSEADKASSLAWQVLEVAHRAPLELTEVDLVAFLDEFAALASRLLPGSIDVRVEPAKTDVPVLADPSRLQQMLANITGNARQAIEASGTIVFRAGAVSVVPGMDPPVRGMVPGRWARLDVIDSGEGIPPHVLPRVFEPFFSTKPPGLGSGLGLSQVRALVDDHDGHVHITSERGQGTTVSLWFPAAGRSATGRGERQMRAETGNAERVLVVEPDPDVRSALVLALEALGYRALAAADGEGALEVLDRVADVRAVISAVAMAGLGGLGLARRLAATRPDVAVILAGGADRDGTEPAVWLRKPFSSRQVGSALRAALRPALRPT